MAKLVKVIHDRVNFAIKKGVTGYISPDTIIQEIYSEIMNMWKKYVAEYQKTQQLHLFLYPFEKQEIVAGLSGTDPEGFKEMTYGYKYPLSIKVTANGKSVNKLTIAEYNHRFNHPIKAPHINYPICRFEGEKIYVSPRLDVTVTYLATPVSPKYAFNKVGDDYVYDDGNSVDLEFDEVLHDDVMNRTLANLGINMRDPALMQYSFNEKATENR